MTARRDDERGADEPDALAGRAAEEMLGPNPFIGLRPEDIAETVRLIGAQAVKQPGVLLEQEAAFARDLISALCGNTDLAPEKGDKRFADGAWQWNPFYRTYLQGYLAWSRALGGFVDKAAVDERTRERIRYVVSLATEALAPTNTLLGNPAAIKKMIDSGGGSVLAGLKQMLGDLMTNRGMPAQVDKQAFRVGENLAQSPGAVVFRERGARAHPVRAGDRRGARAAAPHRAAADQQVLRVRPLARQEHRPAPRAERLPGLRRELAQPDGGPRRLGHGHLRGRPPRGDRRGARDHRLTPT